jgi:hypothetical protein
MRRGPRNALLVLGALAGIVIAAAITIGTSQLVRQHIGLASEPLSAGSRLLPAAQRFARPQGDSDGSADRRAAGTRPKRSKGSPSPRAAGRASPPGTARAPAAVEAVAGELGGGGSPRARAGRGATSASGSARTDDRGDESASRARDD